MTKELFSLEINLNHDFKVNGFMGAWHIGQFKTAMEDNRLKMLTHPSEDIDDNRWIIIGVFDCVVEASRCARSYEEQLLKRENWKNILY